MREAGRSASEQSLPNSLLPAAFDKVFSALGESVKAAILHQLRSRFALALDSPDLTFERLAVAIVDIFGTNGGQFLVERMWVTMEEMASSSVPN